jgi:flagellar hook-associated protein 2
MSTPITLSGFNNIDFKSIINLIMQAENEKVTRVQSDQTKQQTKLTSYGTFAGNLASVQSAFKALTSTTFESLAASSSDETVLTASATSSSTKGSYSIEVQNLARAQVTISAVRQFSDITATLIDGGSFSIAQHGTTTDIDLTGVHSLTELRDAINSQQTGVKASIINDGSTSDVPPRPFRLVLASTQTGAAEAFTINDQTTLNGTGAGTILNLSTDGTNGTARDAALTFNGIQIQSSTNIVSGAIPGLSIKLLKPGSAAVSVDSDDSSLKEKVKAAVNAFNAFNDYVQSQSKITTDGSARPPLATDPLFRGANRQLRSALISDVVSGGSIHNLAEIGVRLERSGKLTFDESDFDAALDSNRADVESFFSKSGGLVERINGLLDSYVGAGGAIDIVKTNTQRTIDSYTTRIQALQAQLALREDTLSKQFSAADTAISQLNSQANALGGLTNQYRLF